MIHNIQVKNEKIDRQLAIALVALYFIHFINNVAKSILPIPILLWDTFSFAGFVIGGVLLIMVLPKAIKRYPAAFIITEGIGVLMYCISFIQNYENWSAVWERGFWTLGICIPMGFMAYSIIEKHILYITMLKTSYYMTALISLVFFFNWFSSPGTYNMSFSYSLLYPLLFHLNEFLNERKTIYLVLSLYQIFLILLYGSRGAVLCFSIFIIIKVVLSIKSIVWKTAIIGLGGIALVLFYVNFESIGNYVLRFFAQNGYYSRTIESFFNGSILQSSGRTAIQDKSFDMIMQKPIVGWGVGGEVQLLDTYPHNIFIELLLNFGILLGGLACVWVVISVLQIFILKSGSIRDLVFIYLCAGFIPLLLSSTYLKQYEVFIFTFLSFQAFSRVVHTKKPKVAKFEKIRAEI